MSLKSYDGKTKKEILGEIVELKRELFNLRMQRAVGELENSSRFRQVRVQIARAYTYLSITKAGS
ncbi:MAG: 50S ribosomal protein L29 [Alphaproteobacteria bacterium]|nr:MAG: 50S ribosomal protein L29 [Alphaproteobacteria bacterium]